jgi:hypothetical protein
MNILNSKKKLGIAIGSGLAVVAIIIGAVGFSMKGKKDLGDKPTSHVETVTSSDMEKKRANGLDKSGSDESASDSSNEGESKGSLLDGVEDGLGYGSTGGDTETVADNSPEEKKEETADVSEINDPNADEIQDEEGDGFSYEVDPEMEKQDAEAESANQANIGNASESLSGKAAEEYISRELEERDKAQAEMAGRSGLEGSPQ